MKVRPGKLYRFDPVGWDVFDRKPNTPSKGTVVKAIKSPPGCPKFGTMGHCYVATPEGKFIGLVLMASLKELEDA